jgi:hypothetical protein
MVLRHHILPCIHPIRLKSGKIGRNPSNLHIIPFVLLQIDHRILKRRIIFRVLINLLGKLMVPDNGLKNMIINPSSLILYKNI